VAELVIVIVVEELAGGWGVERRLGVVATGMRHGRVLPESGGGGPHDSGSEKEDDLAGPALLVGIGQKCLSDEGSVSGGGGWADDQHGLRRNGQRNGQFGIDLAGKDGDLPHANGGFFPTQADFLLADFRFDPQEDAGEVFGVDLVAEVDEFSAVGPGAAGQRAVGPIKKDGVSIWPFVQFDA